MTAAARALGWQGYMGRGTQGAAVETAVVATEFQQLYSAGMKTERPDKAIKPTIRGARKKTNVVKGNKSTAGGYTGPLIPDEIMAAIGWADLLGNNNTVSGSAGVGFTHVLLEPTTSAHYPTYGTTLETNKGSSNTSLMFDFIGSFLKALTVSVPESGEATWSSEYVGVSEVTGGTASSTSYSTVNSFETCMIDIQIGATISSTTAVEYKSAEFKYDNGVSMLFRGNSCTPVGRAYAPIPMVTTTINADLTESLTEYNYWINDTNFAIKIIMIHTTLAGTASGVHSLTIELPRNQMMGDPPELGSAEEIPQITYNCEALTHETLGYMAKVTIVNSDSGAYTGL